MRILDVKTYIAPPPAGSWLNEIQVSTPMSIYPEYRARRSSWRGPNTQDVIIQVLTDEGLTGLGFRSGGVVVNTIFEILINSFLV
jgi:L-rhamnonate dehydratase